MTTKILIIDDDAGIRSMLNYRLKKEGFVLSFCTDGIQARDVIQANLDVDLVILDVMLPGIGGEELLLDIKQEKPDLPVIMFTAQPSLKLGVNSIKNGAYDFVPKPFDLDQLLKIIHNALEFTELKKENLILRQTLKPPVGFSDLIGQSPKMEEVREKIRKAANSRATVLIQGSSGSGKEVVARCLHQNSPLNEEPFIAVNCGAIPENLIESELFGHEKGAYTGADKQTKGKFEQAQNGTIFLDEIGELSLNAQVKLLRVLQEKEIIRVGASESIQLNIRVIAATNRNLAEMVAEGLFREDLYYRLAIWLILLPSLNERGSDVALLAEYFLKSYCELEQKPLMHLSKDAAEFLETFDWPGNVRQLENCMHRTVVANDDVQELNREHIPLLSEQINQGSPKTAEVGLFSGGVYSLAELEQKAILEALEYHNGNIQQAADALEISRITCYRKLKNYGINPDDIRPA